MLKELKRIRQKDYDITIFQTPRFKEKKGFKQVYRMTVKGQSHQDCLEHIFAMFNVPDSIPTDYKGRFITTGDIVYIDEGLRGQCYYQLQTGGWTEINRVHIR